MDVETFFISDMRSAPPTDPCQTRATKATGGREPKPHGHWAASLYVNLLGKFPSELL